jgi:gliding motility-associated-like protein
MILPCLSLSAKHITGGEITYDHLSIGAANSRVYRITLKLFRDENCFNCAVMPTNVSLGIYNNDNGLRMGGFRSIELDRTEFLPLNTLPSCITNPPVLTYKVGYYILDVELPENNAGYTVAYQTCCRIDEIMNVPNQVGATYVTNIPGKTFLGTTKTDSSPRFSNKISVVCYNKPFTLDFSAFDPDANDSLVYMMTSAYNGGEATNAAYNTPGPPPYNPVQYINGFGGSSPLGPLASIDPATGIISGIAPDAGKYVVSVAVRSYRDGIYISEQRKDFIITVAPCDFAGAQLQPNYLSCDGFSFNFGNLNTSPLNETYYWDFGDGNTSTEANPFHTYADTGIYTLKLVVNRGNSCSDSTTSIVKVFPGYFPAFTQNSPMCKGIPVQFRDLTTANYGIVSSWQWDFGNNQVSNDTSRIRNPTYVYTTPGTYEATLIVASNKGCIDTLTQTVNIVDKPEFSISNDTLICVVDTLQLRASASSGGTVTWSPNYMISNVNSFTPLVSPDVTTTYSVVYADNFGCSDTKSVTVKVVNNVTLQERSDTTICRTDDVPLNIFSDALYYSWTPASSLSDASVKEPIATPTAPTTTYHVIARISNKCFREADIIVKTVPYPQANAGKDSSVCFGTSGKLLATGGSSYNWTPLRYLSDNTIPNPIVQNPAMSMDYVVAVRDTFGCPKPDYDTVRIEVVKIIADAGPRDTSVVLTQPLQLNATGSTIYQWTPSRWLSNPDINNPVSLPEDNIEYVVRVSNAIGCFDTDTILVKLFKVDPDLYVPTAFSPDDNGNNDNFKPIPIGMKSLESFLVYNRWGQLVFSTNQIGRGWDGKYKGATQGPGTYVWYAEGTDYLGRKKSKKGTVILIR